MDALSNRQIENELRRVLNLSDESQKLAATSTQVAGATTAHSDRRDTRKDAGSSTGGKASRTYSAPKGPARNAKPPSNASSQQNEASEEPSGSAVSSSQPLISPRNLILPDSGSSSACSSVPASASSSACSLQQSSLPSPRTAKVEQKKNHNRRERELKKNQGQIVPVQQEWTSSRRSGNSVKGASNQFKSSSEQHMAPVASSNKQVVDSKTSITSGDLKIKQDNSVHNQAVLDKRFLSSQGDQRGYGSKVDGKEAYLQSFAGATSLLQSTTEKCVGDGNESSSNQFPVSAQQSSNVAKVSNKEKCVNSGDELRLPREKELEAEYIFVLKKKSEKEARYFCRLCEYRCNTLEYCEKHAKDARHKRLKLMKDEEQQLRQIAPPSNVHIDALSRFVTELHQQVAATKEDYSLREAVYLYLQQAVSKISPAAEVHTYGSTVSGFALSTSDMDVDIKSDKAAELLSDLLEYLKTDKSGVLQDVVSDFTSKMPVITATATANGRSVSVNIGVNNSTSVETSKLLAIYCRLDPRVQPLAIAFRHWAKICRVDKQTDGTLPAYVYGLMVIYFLQQCKPPVLPVLNELLEPAEKLQIASMPDAEYVYLNDLNMVSERWSCINGSPVGLLWLNLLKFLSLEMNVNDVVVCIRQKAILHRSDKKWTSKRLAVEDPFYRKRNIARCLSHCQIYEYISDRMRAAYKYFATYPVLDDEFEFSMNALSDSTGPAVICSTCQKEGHLKNDCPQDRLPPLLPLPTMNKKYLTMLNECLCRVPADFEPTDRDRHIRQSVLAELQNTIRFIYPKAHLCLFGSSCNGFGFACSDLDITLTFDGCPTADGINCVQIIERLAQHLKRQNRLVYNVLAITTAKVPIVKFKHARSGLEGDISLYNTLAQHNTRMMQTYADIDKRVRTLGYIMKVFAKCANICDASRGSLSSYAYILMVIYFLQQRKPPVIPVLQELYKDEKPEQIVDKWNAWFFEDLRALPKVWPGLNKNRESVAELWIGLLRFYTEEFRMDEHVVCIRRLTALTKFEKMWNRFGITIEDPFNLDHNLGLGVSRQMNVYIQKVLRKARKLFGTPVHSLPDGYETIQDYFFDAYQLTDGTPPNDRGCRRCGKIGHFVNECPQGGGSRKDRQDRPAQRKKSATGREDSNSDTEEKTAVDETARRDDDAKAGSQLSTDKSVPKTVAVEAAASKRPPTVTAAVAPPSSGERASSVSRSPGPMDALFKSAAPVGSVVDQNFHLYAYGRPTVVNPQLISPQVQAHLPYTAVAATSAGLAPSAVTATSFNPQLVYYQLPFVPVQPCLAVPGTVKEGAGGSLLVPNPKGSIASTAAQPNSNNNQNLQTLGVVSSAASSTSASIQSTVASVSQTAVKPLTSIPLINPNVRFGSAPAVPLYPASYGQQQFATLPIDAVQPTLPYGAIPMVAYRSPMNAVAPAAVVRPQQGVEAMVRAPYVGQSASAAATAASLPNSLNMLFPVMLANMPVVSSSGVATTIPVASDTAKPTQVTGGGDNVNSGGPTSVLAATVPVSRRELVTQNQSDSISSSTTGAVAQTVSSTTIGSVGSSDSPESVYWQADSSRSKTTSEDDD